MKAAKKLYFDLPNYGRVHAMPGGSIDAGGHKRGSKHSDAGLVGYTEESMSPSMKFKIAARQNDGISARVLSDMTDQNVTAIDDLGNTWILRDGFTTKPVTYSDGEYDVEMEGASIEEVS